jgi:Uncharacterized protein conserved in bacteria (DUF2252)
MSATPFAFYRGAAYVMASDLGSSDAFDRAIAAFAEAYADQNERDHAAPLAEIAKGRTRAKTDL